MGTSVKSLWLRVLHFDVCKLYLKQLLVGRGWRVGGSTNKVEMAECFLLKLGDEYMRVYCAILFISYIYEDFFIIKRKKYICIFQSLIIMNNWVCKQLLFIYSAYSVLCFF